MWSMSAHSFSDNSVESVTITSRNTSELQSLWDGVEFEKIFNSTSYWTKITVVRGANYEKDLVLRTIMLNTGHPHPNAFPALYQIEGNDSFFLIQNCAKFVRKLALTGLKVFLAPGKGYLELSITTNYLSFSLEPLNVSQQIKAALFKRYDKDAKTLDLSNLSEDNCLKDIFFHLNIPQCMQYMVELLKRLFPTNLHTLVLQHNDLRSLESLDFRICPIVALDLRHNNITWGGFEKFHPVKLAMKINAIWLDGNPLCINLAESEFMKRVLEVIPSLKKIDGIDVSNAFDGRPLIKNFIYNGSWTLFTDHFLHHYFGLMESANRHDLSKMYHQRAQFSLTAFHDPVDTPNWSRLAHYLSYSRNLVTLSDLTKAYSTLKIGPVEITNLLNSFPAMQFDPDSFTVDVPICQMNSLILIDVGGIFRERNSFFYFHRSFILTPFKKNHGEWKIETDMMSISPATPEQTEKSFMAVRRLPPPKMRLELNSSTKDKNSLIPAVCEVTKLTKDYAIRILEESSWDLERSLQSFIDQLKTNQIPMHAFTI